MFSLFFANYNLQSFTEICSFISKFKLKLTKKPQMKKLILLLALVISQITAQAQHPKREVRAAWISTVFGIDWPRSADAPSVQRTKLQDILDNLKSSGINTVYFQVRTIGDALYSSSLVPWSHWLTGTYGQNPGWDPLAFAIEESHKRGIEIHAWLNPYRAATAASNIASYSSTHKAKTNPEWLLSEVNGTSTLRYLNPALAEVRNHIDAVVRELVTNYDLDGIHFDDYFYYAGIGTQDNAQFASDPRGFTNQSNWRRDNVTLLIQQLSASIKSLKPWVKFGISPSGIYRNFTVPGSSPAVNTTGSEHYTTQHADTRKWMIDGTIDYLLPQVYWAFSQTTANAKFNYVVDYWNRQNFTRHLYIGLATYRVDPADGSAWSSAIAGSEIKNQIDYLRINAPNVLGASHFTTHDLVSTKPGVKEAMDLVRMQYNTPALIPAMSWIDNLAPAQPTDLTPSLVAGKTKLTWTAPDATTDELQKVVRYAVYRSTSSAIDFATSTHLIAVLPSSETSFTDNSVTPGTGTSYYYAVTSLDRISNESSASNIVPDAVTLPVKLISFVAKKDNNTIKLAWATASETNSEYFLVEKAGADGVFRHLDRQNSSPENTTTVKNYVCFDFQPQNGTNYYRLTQFDKNGSAANPQFASADFNELIIVSAKVFPNPTQKNINFSLEHFQGKSINTRLLNLYGQIIHEEEFNTTTGTSQFQLALKSELPKGQYILLLTDNTFKKAVKLIVL